MSKNLNHVVLSGRLTETPSIRITENENYAVSYSIACNRSPRKNEKGVYSSEVDFIRCETYGPEAEYICRNLEKGDELMIENGRVVTGSYEKEGKKVYYTKIVAQGIIFGRKAIRKHESALPGKEVKRESEVVPEISLDDLSFY